MSTAGQKFTVTFQGISRFFRGISKYFTFSTISRRTPNDVLQDGKVQGDPGKVILEFAVFMLYGRGILQKATLFVVCTIFPVSEWTSRTGLGAGANFFRSPRARVDSLQIFALNRKCKLCHPGTWAWSENVNL